VSDYGYIKQGAIEERTYQRNIARSALRGNTLVVLPTGLGKTIIAILVMNEVLRRKGGKILFLAPTKPLVQQHRRTILNLMNFSDDEVVVFTGEVKKDRRKELWNKARIIISTPQVIQNDLISGDINLDSISLIVFDEAHRAVGNYAYVFIAQEYAKKEDHLILAITASPGGNEEKITEILKNLNIENVEIRVEDDPDVKPYVKEIKIRLVELPMPDEFKELYNKIKSFYEEIIEELRKYGLFITKRKVSRKDIIMEQALVQEKIREGKNEYYQAAMLLNMAIKVDYALEYLETQGFESCYSYLLKIIEEGNTRGGSKASKTLVRHQKFIEIVRMARDLAHKVEELENPKLHALETILRKKIAENPDTRIIVFTHYRETARIVEEYLKDIPNIRAVRFVGQANRGEDRGMSQKEQVEIIKKFRSGEYNVLIATSVAEEGLDIPATDVVIFYEPVPSEIRSIQRRGRTGRTRIGEVYILSIKGTRDVAYLWSSRHKEKKMRAEMRWLRRFLKDKVRGSSRKIFPESSVLNEQDKVDRDNKNDKDKETHKEDYEKIQHGKIGKQRTLFDYTTPENDNTREKLYVDTRELRSETVRILSREYEIVPVQISVGDYILSDRVAVERKTVDDFLASIADGRLFDQAKKLKEEYDAPILIIEGDNLFKRNFRESAIYGAIASLAIDFRIPVLFARDPRESAKIISAIYRRERAERREVALRKERKPMTIEERQRYIVESLPNVSAKLSKRLLEHFGSVRAVMDAEVGDLMKVKGIGRKTAEEIYEAVNSEYAGKKE